MRAKLLAIDSRQDSHLPGRLLSDRHEKESERETERERVREGERETGERRCRQHQDIQLRMRLAGKNEEKVEAGFLHILFKLLC